MSDELSYRLQAALGDGYSIERELGGAGMSRVFTAQEKALERRVVIKVLPPDLAAGVNHERFRREITVAAKLQHPHIVPLLTAGENGGLLWFTMPFIEGESLRAAIARRGRFNVRDVVRVLHDVTDALAYAHARGVVHRDIKPGNILTSGMHALVTDFGVAKALSASIPSANGGTTTGMAIGTPAYMAPEQLAADPAADHRMDIYAVGLLGYELLTGKSPFAGASPQQTLAAQLTQVPDAPHRTLPEVPVPLSDIIMKCLEKDASKRFPSAAALLAELDAMPMFGSGETPSHSVKRRRVAPFAIAATVLVAALTYAAAQRDQLNRVFGSENKTEKKQTAGSANSTKRPNGSGGGSGGNGTTSGTGRARNDSTGNTVGAATRPETVYLYKDPGDEKKSTVLPMVLTRAESLAIAENIRSRQAPEKPATPASKASPATTTAGSAAGAVADAKAVSKTAIDVAITRDSIFAEMGRVFSDSIGRLLKQMEAQIAAMPKNAVRIMDVRDNYDGFVPLMAPPPAGVTRIIVQPFVNATGKRNLTTYTRLFVDSLRLGLKDHAGLEVVDAKMTAQAQGNSSNVAAIAFSLRADFLVAGTLIQRGDSLVLLTTFTDARRGGIIRRLESKMPVGEPLRALPTTIASLNSLIDSAKVNRRIDRGPGRGPDGRGGFDGRGGPDGRGDPRLMEGQVVDGKGAVAPNVRVPDVRFIDMTPRGGRGQPNKNAKAKDSTVTKGPPPPTVPPPGM